MIPLLFVHVAFFCIFFHWCHKFLFLFVSLFCFFFFNSTLIFCFFLNIFSTDELNSARIADVIFQDASTYCMRFIKDHKLQRSQGNLNCKPLYLTHWAKGKILQKFKKLCWGLPVAWKLLPKHSYHSISPLPLSVWGGEGGGGEPSVPNFEKEGGSEKMRAGGVLKGPCHRYLPGGLSIFLVKRTLQNEIWFWRLNF